MKVFKWETKWKKLVKPNPISKTIKAKEGDATIFLIVFPAGPKITYTHLRGNVKKYLEFIKITNLAYQNKYQNIRHVYWN